MALRATTRNALINFVNAIGEAYGKSVLTTKEVDAFRAANPQIAYPESAFWEACHSKTIRASYELNMLESFLQADGGAPFQTASQDQIAKVIEETFETDEEISNRISTRFAVIDMMAQAAFDGKCRSLIVAGSAGVGKSFGIMKIAKAQSEERCSIIRGRVTSKGIFKSLYKHRHEGHVVVFDDADGCFENESTMNLLKAACDSSDERFISMENGVIVYDDEGDAIPSTFEFNGSVIFISNLNMHDLAEKSGPMAAHFKAMISRSHYISLVLKNARESVIHIKNVVSKGLLGDEFRPCEVETIVDYIEENADQLNELSLRMVKKIGDLFLMSDDWKMMAEATCKKHF